MIRLPIALTKTTTVLLLLVASFAMISAARADDIWTQNAINRLQALALIQNLQIRLLTHPSATLTLEQWCSDHQLALPPLIRASRIAQENTQVPDYVRQALGETNPDNIKHRRVALKCGDLTLSTADNWYLPDQLTTTMNQQLEQTDTPFGKVVGPLNFKRRTLMTKNLWIPLPPSWEMDTNELADAAPLTAVLFVHHAVLENTQGIAFSYVEEHYAKDLLNFLPRESFDN